MGLWAGGRFPGGQLLPYVLAQVAGAIAGAGALYLIVFVGDWAVGQLWLRRARLHH